MVTIVEPKKHIISLWGKQEIQECKSYRLMRYLIRVDHDGKVLLHNVVTGQLVVLNESEVSVLNQLPRKYSPVMVQLVNDYFLVPEDYDEHSKVVSTRVVLRKLETSKTKKSINHYVILPTTACNARCYYCFEHGVKTVTMTKETANDTVEFIAKNSGLDQKVSIMWFGGEPTVAANRIDQISEGLQNKRINYTSTMVSNAFLFDEHMVKKAKTLWNLKRIQISVDGMENTYNSTKNYVAPGGNPFERVMRNVGLLIDNGISVDLRMNFNLNSYTEFSNLLKEVVDRYKGNTYLQLYAFPILGEHQCFDGKVYHGDDKWLNETTVLLNNMARDAGLFHRNHELPFLRHLGCGADDDHAVTINAQGVIVECPEKFEDDQRVGTLKEGITDKKAVLSWKEVADHQKCIECEFFPRCFRLKKCSADDRCYFLDRNRQYYEAIKSKLIEWESKK